MEKILSIKLLAPICLSMAMTAAAARADTIVDMQTTFGDIDIELFDTTAPLTVKNFLSYVENGAYNGSFFHRDVPGFVLQGGGYTWDSVNERPAAIPQQAPVVNEFGASNVTGSIAMAKVGGDPNSATNQWFFNLADNSSNLDKQNGGFTVFGQVINNGMQVVNEIASQSVFDLGGDFTDLPVINYTQTEYNQNISPASNNLIFVNDIIILPLPGGASLFAAGLLCWHGRRLFKARAGSTWAE